MGKPAPNSSLRRHNFILDLIFTFPPNCFSLIKRRAEPEGNRVSRHRGRAAGTEPGGRKEPEKSFFGAVVSEMQ